MGAGAVKRMDFFVYCIFFTGRNFSGIQAVSESGKSVLFVGSTELLSGTGNLENTAFDYQKKSRLL